MKAKSESRITAEAIFSAINNGAKSLTAVAKTLGYKSGSSGVIQAILKVVPDLRLRLQSLNDLQADDAEASAKNISANTSEFQIPECVPYRQTSGYAMVWSILYAHRDKGISRHELTRKYQEWSEKPEQNCKYDVQVVCSPTKEGGCNRSAAKASQSYWVERKGDLLLLHLVGIKG